MNWDEWKVWTWTWTWTVGDMGPLVFPFEEGGFGPQRWWSCPRWVLLCQQCPAMGDPGLPRCGKHLSGSLEAKRSLFHFPELSFPLQVQDVPHRRRRIGDGGQCAGNGCNSSYRTLNRT